MQIQQLYPLVSPLALLSKKILRVGVGSICGCIFLVLTLSACSFFSESAPVLPALSMAQASGSLTLARPVPPLAVVDASDGNNALRGFLPVSPTHLTSPLSNTPLNRIIHIDLSSKTIRFGAGKTGQIQATPNELTPGTYRIIHKQESPLWYAPDEYFSVRNITAPAKNDRSRYRKGALGNYALFLTPTLAIHDSSVDAREVGGLRMDSETVKSLFEATSVGSEVVVQ
jgi:lipoprotein-anchoring transpeptidase ErfK/SrfK